METTLIQNISMKDFLSNIKAEAELTTTHLAAKTTDHNEDPTNQFQKFIVISGQKPTATLVFHTHSQEEAP